MVSLCGSVTDTAMPGAHLVGVARMGGAPIVARGRTRTFECRAEAAKIQLAAFHPVDDGVELIRVYIQDAVDELARGRVVKESMGVGRRQIDESLPQDGDG